MWMNRWMDRQTDKKRTELHQFRKEPSYDADLCPCQVRNSIGQTIFELESGHKNVDGQKNGQTNGRNYTNFERNLAMMVIYDPVKYEFDWTNCFRVRVRK